jgi:hypothetical protein
MTQRICTTVPFVLIYILLQYVWPLYTAQKFDGERLNLRKLNELEVRKQYQIEITNRFAALENLGEGKDVNKAWENIKENFKTSAKWSLGMYELKQHKPWFDEECLGFIR